MYFNDTVALQQTLIIWIFTVLLICTTDDEVCRLRNMFFKKKCIVFKIKILTALLLCPSFGSVLKDLHCKIQTNFM